MNNSVLKNNILNNKNDLIFIFNILSNNNQGLLYDLINLCGNDSLLSKKIYELINKINEAQNNVIFAIDNLINIIDNNS